jgi:hypothetical protein
MPDPDETRPIEPPAEQTSEQTVRFTPAQPPPPPPSEPTQAMYAMPPPGGGGGQRLALIVVLVLLVGLAAGYALGRFLGRPDPKVPDESLILYEPASMDFPIAGAAFTRSTYDEQSRRCDNGLLKQYLRADERRFKAWIDLQGITEDRFDAFVDRLETRILDRPRPVTNHGCYGEGDGPCPFAFQSVLAAGTAVWEDPEERRIVAKCRCSNPLKAPKCPPNCEEQPPPSPSPSPTESPTEPPRTQPPTASPTQPPATLPPTFPPTQPPVFTQPPRTPFPTQPPPG